MATGRAGNSEGKPHASKEWAEHKNDRFSNAIPGPAGMQPTKNFQDRRPGGGDVRFVGKNRTFRSGFPPARE